MQRISLLIVVSLLLITLLSACSSAPVITQTSKEPPILNTLKPRSEIATATQVALLPTTTHLPSQTPQPTSTPNPTKTPTPTFQAVEEIVFPDGSNWVDITTYLPKNKDRKFLINANSGEILTVAIQEFYFFDLIGADGTDLAKETLYPYGRFSIPKSQTYTLTIYGKSDVNFRVMIETPGNPSPPFELSYPEDKLSFNYPSLFAPYNPRWDVSLPQNFHFLEKLALVDGKYTQGTNLDEVYVFISASDQGVQLTECPLFSNEENGRLVESENINGVIFRTAKEGDAAAGTQFTYKIYRTFQEGHCYEFKIMMSYQDLSSSPPGTQMFNETGIINLFTQILKFLKFQ